MINKSILVGRLGKDPEVRHLDSGKTVANFSLATTEKQETTWHNIVMWEGLAKIAEQYLKKGDLIYIEGKTIHRSWEKDGQTKYTTEIIANTLQMLGNGAQNN